MDVAAADLLWSLFTASLTSYRRDTVVRPFPPSFLTPDKEKDFHGLLKVTKSCPSLDDVNRDPISLNYQLMNLLKWVLNPKNFTLNQVDKSKFPEIHNLVLNGQERMKVTTPDYVFAVKHSASQEEKFQNLRENRGSLYAFHGSKIENFYSILNSGLKNILNKAALFGEGIYLSSDLNLSLTYSPGGQGWEKSIFGSSLSCVALCEMIDHPDVKCTLKYTEQRGESQPTFQGEMPLDGSVRQTPNQILNAPPSFKSDGAGSSQTVIHRTACKRSRIAGSEGGEIPDRYFVVRNDDLVRVKYILVYCPNRPSKFVASKRCLTSFARRHQFVLLMLFYVFLLLMISLYNSTQLATWWRSL